MKKFFNKTFDLLITACLIYMLVRIFYLAVTDQWISLAKYSFFLAFGGFLAKFEIIEFICWRLRKIITNKDFD